MSDKIGGWTDFKELDQESREVFEKVIADMIGFTREPLRVRTELVAGTNYCFLYTGRPVTLNAPEQIGLLYAVKPIGDVPHFKEDVVLWTDQVAQLA